MLKYFFIAILALFLIINNTLKVFEKSDEVIIGSHVLKVKIADTNEERMQGLSGKENLEEDEGLLFIFTKPSKYGFWMKDMNFPIDIAWIDKNKIIIHIESDVATTTYPKVFYPNEDALYVLETRASFFEKNKIKIGDIVNF